MQQNNFLVQKTERLILRPLATPDVFLAARIMRNPRIVFWRKKRVPLTEIRAGIKRSNKMNEWGLGWWLVFETQTHNLVGSVMLQPLKNTFEIEVGYHMLPEYWGRGYASEAAKQILIHGFEVLGLQRICAVVLPRNRPSLRLVNKLGFSPQGTHFHAELLHRNYILERSKFTRLNRS